MALFLSPHTPEPAPDLCLTDSEDSPHDRRHRIAHYYAEVNRLDGAHDEIDVDAVIETTVVAIHDAWSEIRNDVGRALGKVAHRLPINKRLALLDIFQSEQHQDSWQSIHGNLIGINALIPHIDFGEDTFRFTVYNFCLSLLSHSRLPIREAARQCLSALENSFLSGKVEFILDTIRTNVEKDLADKSETSAFLLHGMLGHIGDWLDKNPLVLIDVINSPRFGTKKHISEALTEVLDLCLRHGASTVRQRASTVLIALLTPQSEDTPDIVLHREEYVSRLVQAMICAVAEACDWRYKEGYLLIIEELLRRLSSYPLSRDNQQLLPLLPCLTSHLSSILLHEIFEIRRMGTQLLPSLARAALLHDHSLLIPPIPAAEEVGQVCVYFAWFSEVIKNAEHMAEIVYGWHKWGVTSQRRLGEEEKRQVYHNNICDMISSSDTQQLIVSTLNSIVMTLKNACEVIHCVARSVVVGGVVSADMVEALVLIIAFYHSLREMTGEVDGEAAETKELAVLWIRTTASIQSFAYDGTKPLHCAALRFLLPPEERIVLPTVTDPVMSDWKLQIGAAHSLLAPAGRGGVMIDKWVCEAVVGVLSEVAGVVAGKDATTLALILSRWLASSTTDTLWLEGASSRKGIVEAMYLSFEEGTKGKSDLTSEGIIAICESVLAAIRKVMTAPKRLDTRSTILLVRMCIEIVRMMKFRDVVEDIVPIVELLENQVKELETRLYTLTTPRVVPSVDVDDIVPETVEAEFSDWDDTSSDDSMSKMGPDTSFTSTGSTTQFGVDISALRHEFDTLIASLNEVSKWKLTMRA